MKLSPNVGERPKLENLLLNSKNEMGHQILRKIETWYISTIRGFEMQE
jgi:hypothetical protein